MEKNMSYISHESSYCWLINENIKKYIIEPYLPSQIRKKTRREKKIIDNRKCLCTHGHMHPLKFRMGNMLPYHYKTN